jgi:ketosteroid isomerase-like protein
MREMHRTVAGLSLATAILLGFGAAHAQPTADIAAVTAANNAYYTALSALDLPSIEKAWAHEDYDALAGPRHPVPLIGWVAIQAFYAKNVDNLAEISVKPVDVHIRINGNSAWTISREEVGSTSRLKNGTLISSRPTIATNMFEKYGDKWLMVAHHAQEISQ